MRNFLSLTLLLLTTHLYSQNSINEFDFNEFENFTLNIINKKSWKFNIENDKKLEIDNVKIILNEKNEILKGFRISIIDTELDNYFLEYNSLIELENFISKIISEKNKERTQIKKNINKNLEITYLKDKKKNELILKFYKKNKNPIILLIPKNNFTKFNEFLNKINKKITI